jgi:uncharacterized membrane protein
VQVTSEVRIARPADEVFAFIADAENNPTWQDGMRSCRWVTEPPIAVGSRYAQHASFVGRDIESLFEVVALEPDTSITIETIESTFPIRVTRSVEPVGEGSCLVRAGVSGEPGGLFRFASPLLKRMVRRSVRNDYARLVEKLEAG